MDKNLVGIDVFRDAVRAAFDYEDGVLRWRVSPSRNVKIGAPAGSPNQRGYLQIKWNRKSFVAHKLIFAYHHGWMPPVVDHIDGDTTNNKIDNLRAATAAENQWNAKRRYNNSSGYKNVRKHGQKWQVCVIKDGLRHYYGRYDDPQEAAIVAKRAREKLHGDFARHA